MSRIKYAMAPVHNLGKPIISLTAGVFGEIVSVKTENDTENDKIEM